MFMKIEVGQVYSNRHSNHSSPGLLRIDSYEWGMWTWTFTGDILFYGKPYVYVGKAENLPEILITEGVWILDETFIISGILKAYELNEIS